MCTAITYSHNNFYFGRNLDFENSFDEKIVITGRSFPFFLRNSKKIESHYAIIGMGIVSDNFPLYFDAVNEFGLCMAGLLFPEAAHFRKSNPCKNNIASFELIPYVLCKCKTIAEARELLAEVSIIKIDFSNESPLTPLHWIVSDKTGSLAVEPVAEGLKVYSNHVGVLTNSPSFDMQLFNLNNYMNLSPKQPTNSFSKGVPLFCYSFGMGSLGLPGDLSSMSRFVRACFTKQNCTRLNSESEFFHILNAVYQTCGLNDVGDGEYEYTRYSCCYNTTKLLYCYTTYGNLSLCAIDMNKVCIYDDKLIVYPHINEQNIMVQNDSL